MSLRSLVLLWFAGIAPLATAQGSVASRIDHFSVESPHAEELFSVFANTFKLPVIWPMAGYGSFSSGGLYLGNVVLEIGHFGKASPTNAKVAGIIFDPAASADASVAELDRRHISHGVAEPYVPAGGDLTQPQWTNVRVREIGPAAVGLVICDYHIDTKTGLANADVELRRSQGGPLGISGVREVVLETRNLEAARATWGRFLAPARERSPGVFEMSGGPVIRLIAGARDDVSELIVEVASLHDAKAFLNVRAIAFEEHGDALDLASGLQGAPLRLVQRP